MKITEIRLYKVRSGNTGERGAEFITAMAISGVDLALWDLMGKALRQPVYRLLGGATKESIPCYVTTHPDLAGSWKDSGFLGVKIAAPWGSADRRPGLVKMQRCLERCSHL